ncbi:thioredoxin-like domain-containing protein [Petrimonas sp.]|uniref:thioredoxin-like domain-containing protein n=1 Tax=Petrimonas TaxID=307628 RepID=UPI001BD528F5|nr:redoxin domain-containing protein [Petrimonas sp.]
MKKYVSLLPAVLLTAAVLLSCQSEKTFEVKGELSAAGDQTLYLEHRGLGGVELLDSVKLKENGKFAFKEKAPVNPEFYQLRVGSQVAVFAIDSIETLQVRGDAKDLASTLSIENSPVNEQIRQIDSQTRQVNIRISEAEKKHTAKAIDDVAYLAELDSVLTAYKAEITKLILGNPSGAAAYYAVFQKVDGYLIFDPYNKQDYAMFGAVATSWDRYYPGTPRSKHLYDFTMNALKTRRQQEQQAALLENVPVVSGLSLPDIVLTEVNGEKITLSSQKGKVVVLDFTVYKSDFSPAHNMELNKIYSQHKAKGLEIYQISFDSDEHFWKNAASNLPWITVRDPQNVYSRLLSTYNVRDIPTAFVINRDGDVVARVENYATLPGEVGKVL